MYITKEEIQKRLEKADRDNRAFDPDSPTLFGQCIRSIKPSKPWRLTGHEKQEDMFREALRRG